MASSLSPALAPASWRERWLGTRDRWLGSARFRRWASAFPLTRAIARRRAGQLFDLCAGFVYSQVLLACVRLRLFELLAHGPMTVDELAARMALGREATERLLRAAASLDLVQPRRGERFGLGPVGVTLVDNPAIAALVEHHAILYADLQDPVALLSGGGSSPSLARYWPYAGMADPAGLADGQVEAYTRLMSVSSTLVAEELLEAYPFAQHECLVDVGGGDGTFLARVSARVPHLRSILFDLPPVAVRAARRFALAGLSGRARAVGGDFHDMPIPAGADVATLIRILHDHDDGAALALLRAVHRALPPGGTVVVAEPMSGVRGAERAADAYFGLYLLAMGSGRPRTPERLSDLLRLAGFDTPRRLGTRIPVAAQILVARRLTDRV